MPGQELIDSIKRRSKNNACESCGNTSWMIQDGEYALVEVVGGNLAESGIPVSAVVCDQCGFTRLYSNLIGDNP